MAIAELQGASKVYQVGDNKVTALHQTDIEIKKNELLLIIGPSGSGKTTLLSLIGSVIYPTEGEVMINDKKISDMDSKEMARVRLQNIGFVFQSVNLIAPLTAIENVAFPLLLRGVKKKEAYQKALEALEKFNVADRKDQLPGQLSGGQQQRVGIARALVGDPPILLCDEPTASLDPESIDGIMNELHELAQNGKAVLVVSHDLKLKQYADRVIKVEGGRVKDVDAAKEIDKKGNDEDAEDEQPGNK